VTVRAETANGLGEELLVVIDDEDRSPARSITDRRIGGRQRRTTAIRGALVALRHDHASRAPSVP
jgi:hypothetical protein